MSLPAGRLGQWLSAVLIVGPLIFLAAGAGLFSMASLTWLTTWASSWLFLAVAVLLWARVILHSGERDAWCAFAIAATLWAAANFYSAFAFYPSAAPVLSWADLGYLAFPLFFSIGVLCYSRIRVPRVPLEGWLDALTIALAASAVLAAVIFASTPVRAESFADITTTVLYPVEDVIVVGLFVGLGAMIGWRLRAAGRLLVLAIACITVGDVLTLTRVLEGSTYGGAWPNLGWAAGIVLLAAAAWRNPETAPRLRPITGVPNVRIPTVAGLVALGVVILSSPRGLGPIACALGVAAVVVVFARFLLTVRQVRALADSRRLALTDDLTGLPNRRRLLADLAQACHELEQRVLTLFDLDGFKQFNDVYGHPAGDELLSSLGAALGASVPAGGQAYRLGGDEFCTLVPAGPTADQARTDALIALTAHGESWSVTASHGSVMLGSEARDPSAALQVADRRMYERKHRRPGAARQQVRDALLGALGEQQPTLHTHTQDVTALVEDVARRLRLSEREIDDAVRAAELHDIGKLAISPAILEKPGPLDDEERAVMNTHTVIGERMLRSAPALRSVAPLVRASHERWDGKGYPDGLAGEAIPIGARIVAVCDAFDAMIAERPYRSPRTEEEAVAELRRCAGTQFDPAVVQAFIASLGHEL